MSMRKKTLTAANGYAYTVQVNDEDAERYGLKPSKRAVNEKGPEPENKRDDEADKPRRPGAARRREQ